MARGGEEAAGFFGDLVWSISEAGTRATELTVLETAMVEAAKEALSVEGRRQPGGFVAARESPIPAIEARNRTAEARKANNSEANHEAARQARRALRRAVGAARTA